MNTRRTIITSLFAALIIVGAYLRIPFPPVPITLQTLFAILAALLGGWRIGVASTAIYLILGAIGLPVFTAGGGIALLIGPTGGYLLALLPATFVAGLFADRGYKSDRPHGYRNSCIIGGFLATLIIYLVGIPMLKYSRSLSWKAAVVGGMLPFLVGDLVKLVVAVIVSSRFADRIRSFISYSEQ